MIVYSPMQSGLLTGAFTAERAARLPADDWRSRSPDFGGEGLRRNLALVDALRPIAKRHHGGSRLRRVDAGLARRDRRDRRRSRPEQIDDWLAAATVELSDADLDEIAETIRRLEVGSGPRRAAR